MNLRLALTLSLPMTMFGVAVSFFTLVASGSGVTYVWPYAAIMAGLTLVNLAISVWGARARHR